MVQDYCSSKLYNSNKWKVSLTACNYRGKQGTCKVTAAVWNVSVVVKVATSMCKSYLYFLGDLVIEILSQIGILVDQM